MLVNEDIHNAFLLAAAETANIFHHGKPRTSVVTNETIQKYQDAMQILTDISSSYFKGKIPILQELLRSTTAGKQGVPPENMMLNLWRYIRKVIAKELYANGFFTDTIPEDGKLTIFYENNVEFLRKLLWQVGIIKMYHVPTNDRRYS